MISYYKEQSIDLFSRANLGRVVCLCVFALAISTGLQSVLMALNLTLTEDTTIDNLAGSYGDVINTNGYTLTLNNTSDTTYKGTITGSGNVFKTGNGSLTFQNTGCTYTGTTTVAEGTMRFYDGNYQVRDSSSMIILSGATVEVVTETYFTNLSGAGNIIVADNTKLGLYNTQDSEFSGVISGNNIHIIQTRLGTQSVIATQTFSGANTFTGKLEGYSNPPAGSIKLAGDAVVANSQVLGNMGRLYYDVSANNTKYLDINDTSIKISANESVTKTGDGTLQIFSEADGLVGASSWVISSGRMDYQGYFRGYSDNVMTNNFVVNSGSKFSPGVGIGSATINRSNFDLRSSATALFEFGVYNEDPSQQNFDTLIVAGDWNEFKLDGSSIIELAFTANDAWKWAKEGAEYHIVTEKGMNRKSGDYSYLLGNYQDYFKLEGKYNNGLYLIGRGAPEPEPETAVPEPSTWALLALGIVALFLRKRK